MQFIHYLNLKLYIQNFINKIHSLYWNVNEFVINFMCGGKVGFKLFSF